MSLDRKKVALLVHSCDRYELLYTGFVFFFSRYWDFNIDCNLYFATEEKIVSIADFQNIQSGKGEWADRLALLLREKISEPYVLYFQEDMWLDKKVNAAFFNQLFSLTEVYNWQQAKLHSSGVYKTNPTDLFIEGFNVAKINNEESDFLMSHQVTLWNKEFLLQQLKPNEHPWRNERKGTKRLKKQAAEILHIDYFSENGSPAINQNNRLVLRSGYRTVSMNGMLNSNVEWYIEELKKGGDEYLSYALSLEHNYRNNLTHDGKPKPRKVDVFKQAKNWLKGK